MPVPNDILLESSTLQDKEEVMVESVQQATQQQQQMQQAQMQAAIQELQSKIKLNDAQAVANQGLGLERISRVEENEALAVERRAAAVKDQEVGFLNLVRALKEIDDIDLAHVEKLIKLSHVVKAQEAMMIESNPQAEQFCPG